MANTFNDSVIEEFRANGGKVGGPFAGAPMVLVNTIGAKSVKGRTTPLVSYSENGQLYVTASAGGSPKHPAWYRNLKANPDVTIEIGDETREVTITEVPADERADIWSRLVALMPQFGEYEKTTEGRVIPLLRITPR